MNPDRPIGIELFKLDTQAERQPAAAAAAPTRHWQTVP
jgi:hypothetical protein